MNDDNVTPSLDADRDLIRRGAAVCGSQKALAAVCGCSERLLSEVMNGKRMLPHMPLPLVGKTPRALIEAAIAAGGDVPQIHRGPGRIPRVTTDKLRIPVTREEKLALDATAVDLNDAVMAWIAAYQKDDPDAPWAPDAFPPVPDDATLIIHRVLTPKVHGALLTYLDGDVGQRDACVRAALRRALGYPVELVEGAP